MVGEEKSGPADEYEAFRARLLTAMRRQPGDTRSLMRMYEGLSRMMVAQERPNPRKVRELSANLRVALDQLGDSILPAR